MNADQVVSLLVGVAWPAIVLVSIIVLRKPLGRFLSELGQRTSKIDLHFVVLELKSETRPDWLVYDSELGRNVDIRHLTTQLAFDSQTATLINQLSGLGRADVLELDLGTGQDWLTSRLYLFSAVLAEHRGVRCVALTRTRDGRSGQVLGWAPPEAILTALAEDEPWLERSYISARHQIRGVKLLENAATTLDLAKADDLVEKQPGQPPPPWEVGKAFIRLNQRSAEPGIVPDGWLRFEVPNKDPVWEHTRWLDPAQLPPPLHKSVDQNSMVVFDPTESQNEFKRRILLQESPFVLLQNRDGTLRGVVERAPMLDQALRTALSD